MGCFINSSVNFYRNAVDYVEIRADDFYGDRCNKRRQVEQADLNHDLYYSMVNFCSII